MYGRCNKNRLTTKKSNLGEKTHLSTVDLRPGLVMHMVVKSFQDFLAIAISEKVSKLLA